MVDMAHIAGLVATKNANNPFTYSDIVTTTTHKSLRGPRSGMIFCRKEFSDKIDFSVFPSLQGGPHNNVISAVSVALKEATTNEYKIYIGQVKKNAKELGEKLKELGYKLSTDGTDNHLILVNLRDKGITGSKVECILENVCISVNKNSIIGDKSALSPGGIRIGLCAITTRGLKEFHCQELSKLLDRAITLGRKIKRKKLVDFKKVIIRYLNNEYNENEIMDVVELQQIKKDVIQFSEQFPFHYKL